MINRRVILILFVLINLIACNKNIETKEFTISGRLIDSTHNRNWIGYNIEARTQTALGEQGLSSAIIDEKGNFKLTYSTNEFRQGDELRLSVYPLILAQDKLNYLPIGENWHKNFLVGDSARVHINLNRNLKESEKISVIIGSKLIEFHGPNNNLNIGTHRVSNVRVTISYYLDNENNKYYEIYNPTGDPIIDTITLNINP